MKNFFEHTSSSWVRYSEYEWKESKEGKLYQIGRASCRERV